MDKVVQEVLAAKISKFVLREMLAEGMSEEESLLIAYDTQEAFKKAINETSG